MTVKSIRSKVESLKVMFCCLLWNYQNGNKESVKCKSRMFVQRVHYLSSMCVAWCKSDLTNYNRNLVCSKSNKEQLEQPLPELLSWVLSKDPKKWERSRCNTYIVEVFLLDFVDNWIYSLTSTDFDLKIEKIKIIHRIPYT